MYTINSKDVKVLQQFINSTNNEFKKYTLLQLWLSQLFTDTINDPIKEAEQTTTDIVNLCANVDTAANKSNVDTTAGANSAASIYNLFRDIKQKLIIKNQQLRQVYDKMLQQLNILKVMNVTLQLDNMANNAVQKYKTNVDKLLHIIETNDKYIDGINNLSEAKIESICQSTIEATTPDV